MAPLFTPIIRVTARPDFDDVHISYTKISNFITKASSKVFCAWLLQGCRTARTTLLTPARFLVTAPVADATFSDTCALRHVAITRFNASNRFKLHVDCILVLQLHPTATQFTLRIFDDRCCLRIF